MRGDTVSIYAIYRFHNFNNLFLIYWMKGFQICYVIMCDVASNVLFAAKYRKIVPEAPLLEDKVKGKNLKNMSA